jgi:hypothetical protein
MWIIEASIPKNSRISAKHNFLYYRFNMFFSLQDQEEFNGLKHTLFGQHVQKLQGVRSQPIINTYTRSTNCVHVRKSICIYCTFRGVGLKSSVGFGFTYLA